jgi:DNA-binding NarL/FixJ family response regulator
VRVLVVDDSPSMRRMLRLVLAELPHVVLVGEAASGEECLRRLDRLAPDVVVMDWRMPGINGVQATERLLESRPDVHVIGFTSSGTADVSPAFLDAGAAAVFAKEQALELRDYLAELAVPAAR